MTRKALHRTLKGNLIRAGVALRDFSIGRADLCSCSWCTMGSDVTRPVLSLECSCTPASTLLDGRAVPALKAPKSDVSHKCSKGVLSPGF